MFKLNTVPLTARLKEPSSKRLDNITAIYPRCPKVGDFVVHEKNFNVIFSFLFLVSCSFPLCSPHPIILRAFQGLFGVFVSLVFLDKKKKKKS